MDDTVNAFVSGTMVPIAGQAGGPLDGLSFAVKDLFDVAGLPTGGGNHDWALVNPVPERHAWAVQTLLDAGASFVVRKPVAPMVMMQRILWLLNDQRKFVTSPGYCGPDRRVKALGPPVGMKGRRHDDLSAEVGAASTPNLGQDEIDALFKPKAVI